MLNNLKIWNRFQDEIGETDLRTISEADRGDDAKEHFLALKSLLRSGQLPNPLPWDPPHEVLALWSWSQYSQEDTRLSTQTYFCSVVLVAACVQEQELDGEINRLIIAIDISNFLGQGRIEEMFEFILYLLPKVSEQNLGRDFLYYHLALYILAVILEKPSEEIEKLIANVLSAEDIVAKPDFSELRPDIFSYTHSNVKIWRRYYEKYANLLEARRKMKFHSLFGYND